MVFISIFNMLLGPLSPSLSLVTVLAYRNAMNCKMPGSAPAVTIDILKDF